MEPTYFLPLRAATAHESNRLAEARRAGPFVAWRDGSRMLNVRVLAPGDGEPWTVERLAGAMAPFWAAHPTLLTTPEARRPDRTRFDAAGPDLLRAQQVLVDGEGDEDWSCDVLVDTTVRVEGTPRIVLVGIGV